jgi:hypothetical protein
MQGQKQISRLWVRLKSPPEGIHHYLSMYQQNKTHFCPQPFNDTTNSSCQCFNSLMVCSQPLEPSTLRSRIRYLLCFHFELELRVPYLTYQALDFLSNHSSTIVILLKNENDQVPLALLEEIHLIITLCASVLPSVPKSELVSPPCFSGFVFINNTRIALHKFRFRCHPFGYFKPGNTLFGKWPLLPVYCSPVRWGDPELKYLCIW